MTRTLPRTTATPRVLFLDPRADEYALALARELPDLTIHAATHARHFPGNPEDIDVLAGFGTSFSDALLQRATSLKWVQALSAGVDSFLNAPALRPDVLLTSARGIHGPGMRENVLFLLLMLTHNGRRIAASQAAGRWVRNAWPLLDRKTAVVLGTGYSGQAVAEALTALGMNVVGVSRTPRRVPGFHRMVPTAHLVEAAAIADFLISVLPGEPANRGLVNRAVLAAMRPHAYFVNVGRGETADEAALIEALQQRRIAGAGLDVFQTEPLPPESPLWSLDNVVITPHIGGLFAEYVPYALPIFVENLRHFMAGEPDRMRNIIAR